MTYHYKYKNANSAMWHDKYIEAETQAEAQTKIIKELGTDFEMRIISDDVYTEDELLQIDALT